MSNNLKRIITFKSLQDLRSIQIVHNTIRINKKQLHKILGATRTQKSGKYDTLHETNEKTVLIEKSFHSLQSLINNS